MDDHMNATIILDYTNIKLDYICLTHSPVSGELSCLFHEVFQIFTSSECHGDSQLLCLKASLETQKRLCSLYIDTARKSQKIRASRTQFNYHGAKSQEIKTHLFYSSEEQFCYVLQSSLEGTRIDPIDNNSGKKLNNSFLIDFSPIFSAFKNT